jgi:hypothetical protein
MPAIKLSMPFVALAGFFNWRGASAAAPKGDPLPPLVVVEGIPDPSLTSVIEAAAERLGATVCTVDALADLVSDPDLEAIVAVVLTRPRAPRDWAHAIRDARAIVGDRPIAVLAPQPTSLTLEAALPLDPAFVAPPVSVDRLLFAFGVGSDTQA